MTLATDLAADWNYIDGIESVTHTADSDGTATASVKAHRSEVTYREMAGGIDPTTAVWVVWPRSVSPTITVVQGDTLTDAADGVWTVDSVIANQQGTGATVVNYRCFCTKQPTA